MRSSIPPPCPAFPQMANSLLILTFTGHCMFVAPHADVLTAPVLRAHKALGRKDPPWVHSLHADQYNCLNCRIGHAGGLGDRPRRWADRRWMENNKETNVRRFLISGLSGPGAGSATPPNFMHPNCQLAMEICKPVGTGTRRMTGNVLFAVFDFSGGTDGPTG